MPTLYEIAEDVQALDALIDEHLTATEGEITPEVEAVIDAWLTEHEADLSDKLEGYFAVVKENEAQAKLIDGRAKAFKAMYEDERKLADTRTNRAKALKRRLQWFYELRGLTEMQAGPYKIALQKNGGVQPLIVDEGIHLADICEHFLKIEIDTAKVREFLEQGGKLTWARLGERGQSIRIK